MFRRSRAFAAATAVVAVLAPLAGTAVPSFTDPVALAAVRVRAPADLAALQRFDLAEARHGDEIEVVLWPGDRERLRTAGLPYRILVPDLVAADRRIRAEDAAAAANGQPRTSYRRLADYERELRELADRFPGHVRLLAAPHRTHEGRTVLAVELGAGDLTDGRPAAYIDGLHHAREWPAAEVAMEFARELAEGYGGDPRITSMLDATRVIIVPVVNPDGFTWSRETPVDGNQSVLSIAAGGQGAYWRKNRRGLAHLPEQHLSLGSYGVDPNRNYAFYWGGGGLGGGPASAFPFDQTYQGTEPFSEPETQNVRDFLLRNNVVTLISNHTYSRLVLWPWGHTADRPPDQELEELGMSLAQLSGYRGMQGIGLYPTTGTTDDWAYAATGMLGYTFEIGTSFHPPYGDVARLYGQVRPAFYKLVEAAAEVRYHSVLTGRVTGAGGGPVAATLRLHKRIETPTLAKGAPFDGGDAAFEERINLKMRAGADGSFEWHVNPSSRPIAEEPERYTLIVEADGHASRSMEIAVARGERLDLGVLRLDTL